MKKLEKKSSQEKDKTESSSSRRRSQKLNTRPISTNENRFKNETSSNRRHSQKSNTRPMHITNENNEVSSKILQDIWDQPTMTRGINMSNVNNAQAQNSKHEVEKVRINLKRCIYPVLHSVALEMGMEITRDDEEDWDVCWSDFSISTIISKKMELHNRINHFPGMANLESKAFLAYHLNRMKYIFPDEYDIFPKSWSLPNQYREFIAYNKEHTDQTYIFKPTRGAEGKGIKIFNRIGEEEEIIDQQAVCQLYLSNLLLMDGFKFDLRLYVLMTSIDPLRIFVYNNGLVRLATCQYKTPKSNNLANQFMHLTNYSINKHSENYDESPEYGSKRDLIFFNSWLLDQKINSAKLWGAIDDIIIKTIISVYPIVKDKYQELFRKHYQHHLNACFEIFGFDILIDDTLKPYLLEVNRSPSFNIAGEIDNRVKKNLILDTFKINCLNQNRRDMFIKSYDLQSQAQTSNDANFDEQTNENVFKTISEKLPNRVTQKSNTATVKHQVKWENQNLGDYRLIYPINTTGPCPYRRYINKLFNLPEMQISQRHNQ